MENIRTTSEYFYERERIENEKNIATLKEIYMETIIKPYRTSEKIIDLHCHSNYSDGELSPYQIIRLAIEKRIGVLSITDHDTIEGIKNVDRSDSLILDSGIKIINGIELSAKAKTGRMHILGYDIDINNINLNNKMSELKDNSINSLLSIMEQIKKDYKTIFKYDDIKELINSNQNLGRPDLAILCVKYGYAKSVQEAFDKYLINAFNNTRSSNKGLQYQECIDLILKSGGIQVLAHSKTLQLSKKKLLILLKEMIQNGLMGIEVFHPIQNQEDIDFYTETANNQRLLISGGSDFHGPVVKSGVELGYGKIKKMYI